MIIYYTPYTNREMGIHWLSLYHIIRKWVSISR
nr:MAG TPA: Pregnancy-associated plasma protein-A [Bacteriophage sp.]